MPKHKRPDSPYFYGHVYGPTGATEVRSLRVEDPKAADAILREWERELADPAYAASKASSLERAIKDFLDFYESEARVGKKAKDTSAYYAKKLGTVARILGPGASLHMTATPGSVDSYIKARREEKAGEHTIKKELDAWKAVLRRAKRMGQWPGDLGAVFPRFESTYEPRDRTLSEDEVYALLALAPSDDTAAQIAFAVATSAELGCIKRAQREDVVEDYVLLRGTKRKLRWRTVPVVTPWQKGLLDFALRNARGEAPFLFASTEGLRNELRRRTAAFGVAGASPNDLRRTFAVFMREAGFPLELIAPLMGHANTRMLEAVYGRLTPEQLRGRLLLTMRLVAAAPLNSGSVWNEGGAKGSESSQKQADSKTLSPRKKVPRGGIEPPTRGFSVQGSDANIAVVSLDYSDARPARKQDVENV